MIDRESQRIERGVPRLDDVGGQELDPHDPGTAGAVRAEEDGRVVGVRVRLPEATELDHVPGGIDGTHDSGEFAGAGGLAWLPQPCISPTIKTPTPTTISTPKKMTAARDKR